MIFTKEGIEQAVDWACSIAAPGVIIEEDALLEQAGVKRLGKGHDYKAHDQFRLELLKLRTAVVDGVLERKGYHLVAKVGVGFQVAKPKRVIGLVTDRAYRRIINEANRGIKVLRGAKIPAKQQKDADAAEISLGGVKNFAERQAAEKRKKKEADQAIKEARAARKKEEVR